MKWLVPFAVAIAAAMVLWGSAAGASPGGAVGPLAKGLAVSHHQISLAKAKGAVPRGLDGVPAKGNYAFLLKLDAAPTGRVYESTLPRGVSAARTAAKTQLATVRAAQSRVIAALPMATHVLYKTHAVLAGVAVYTNVANVPALQRISGVAHVYPIAPKKPSLSYSVHLVKAPEAWHSSNAGSGSSIAIIDTGIDYTHADFGGSGNPADYQTALATDDQDPTYPDTNKVSTESYDFAGDSYNADPNDPAYNPVPSPDNNPLDCDGHGTHTSGIAAGYGENPDGTTYTGGYGALNGLTSSAYQALFRIGPGMAPQAKLYEYKVFGCAGSTDLVGAAIDRAVDPNDDGSPADHVDVISMSLGADFASPQDGDAVEANAASAAGVSVVAAAGNGGDLFDVNGSPGNAQSVISVAASVDAYNQIDTLHADVNGGGTTGYGAQRSVAYDWTNDPDLSGSVAWLSDPADSGNQDGCDPIATNLTGKIAFLEWTDDSTVRRCGSATRSQNAEDAGAIGVIIGEDSETFAAGITGSATIPVVQVVKSASDTIENALKASQTVTVSGTTAGDFSQLVPGDDDKVASFSSRGIRNAGDVKPDVSAIGASVFSAGMGSGNEGVSESGTSMATPMAAGLDALVRNQNPGWTPEEVKADIMNTAGQDLFTGDAHSGDTFAPNRVGAGRIDAQAALSNPVLAFVTDDPGAVSASFGPLEVTGPTTLHKTINLENTSGTDETYDTSYDALTTIPGVVYSVSPSQVTVPANDSTTATLTLTIANPALLTKTIDPTMDSLQGGLPREYLADASGRVLFTPQDTSLPTLRVPVYSAPRPASSMTQPASLDMPGGAIQTKALPLSGTGVSQGSGPEAIQSIVAGFELQDVSPALPVQPSDQKAADIKYVGTTSDAPQLNSIGDDPLSDGEEYFAITTYGPWHTPASQNEYDIYIDSNGDGIADEVVFNTRLTGTDVFVSAVYDLSLGEVIDEWLINDRFGDTDTALFDSDTLVMPVFISDLPGISAGHSRIHYGIVSFGSFSGDPVDFAGFDPNTGDLTLTADVLNPGVSVAGSFNGTSNPVLYADMPGTSLTVRRDAAAYAADHGMGAMIVHFHNTVGNKAQIVDLDHHTLTVTKSGSGTGTVTSSPAGINCGSACTHSFSSGTVVTLTASPAAGSAFAGWSGGGCSGTGSCVVTMDVAKTVTATFSPKHTLTVNETGTGSGTVTSSPSGISCGTTCSATFAAGTSVTLTPHPASGSTFAGWSGACTGSGGCTVTMSGDLAVTAKFAVDTTRPRITSLKVKVNHHKRTAKVIFKGTDPGHGSTGLRYRCKLDKGKFKSCRSPKLYKHLRHGKHTVRVKVIDRAGNVSKPATKKFKV